MTRPSKIALTVTSSLIFSILAYGTLLPRSARAFASRLLSSPHKFGVRSLTDRTKTSPALIFWAWERPEDFRFLKPGQAAIAFLAKTIYLQPPPTSDASGNTAPFFVHPRLQPLRIAPGTPLIAVVRIELPPAQVRLSPRPLSASLRPASYSSAQREDLASEIASLQTIPGISAIQIDFDAPASAHPFYAALLQDVRRKLPASLPLSITALASWCIGDPWLAQLPPGTIDEAVPMLFRMGHDAADVSRFFHSGTNFPVPACQSSLGLSTDEPLLANLLNAKSSSAAFTSHHKRIYIFAPHSWSPSDAAPILKELHP